MDNFKVMYKMLKALEKGMGTPGFSLVEDLTPESLGITREEWNSVLVMLIEEGLIRGPEVKENIIGDLIIGEGKFRLTLKGAEYLKDNSHMRKIHNLLMGVKEITPKL